MRHVRDRREARNDQAPQPWRSHAGAGKNEPMGESERPTKDDEQDAAPAEPTAEVEAGATEASRQRRRIPWGWIVLALLVIEFGVYGSKGHIEVCVGKEGVHDFELAGQERTDENRWRFPRCESRTNLGLRSTYEEKVEEAVRVACRGATMIQHRGEGRSCIDAEDGWLQRIEATPCPPWHRHFWGQLLWFLG